MFLAAAIQVMVAGITILGSSQDPSNAHLVRYVDKSDITETLGQLTSDMLRQQSFGKRAFVGGLLTALISWLVLRF